MQKNISAEVKEVTDEMKYPKTVICAVVSRVGNPYITFAHDFPKNVASATMKKIFYIGLPAQPAINVNVSFDRSSGTDWAIPYAYITDSTMLNYIDAYATLTEIELTYS